MKVVSFTLTNQILLPLVPSTEAATGLPISSTLTPGFSHSHKTKTAITPGTIEFYITHDLQ